MLDSRWSLPSKVLIGGGDNAGLSVPDVRYRHHTSHFVAKILPTYIPNPLEPWHKMCIRHYVTYYGHVFMKERLSYD